jgi:hypothetical protein
MGDGSAASSLCCTRDLQPEIHHTEAKMGNHESNHEPCQDHRAFQSYQVGGSTDAFHAEEDPGNLFFSTNLSTDSLDSPYLAAATVGSMVVLGETEDELSRPSITTSNPGCEQNSDLWGNDSDALPSLEATIPSPRVSFLPFVRVMDIPKIDLRDVHLFFYSQENITQFRHDKWVEEHGFDPDFFSETGEEETPTEIRNSLKTDSSTRRVSFSDNVEILWIPRIQKPEWDLCFYNSDDFAQFRHEEWEEHCSRGNHEPCQNHRAYQSYQAGGSNDAFHAGKGPGNHFCGTDLPTDSLDSSYLLAATVGSMVVLGEPEDDLSRPSRPSITSCNPECEQNSDLSGNDLDPSLFKRRVSFLPLARVMDIPKIDIRDLHLCFYSQEDITQFRHDRWVEEHDFDPDYFLESGAEETPTTEVWNCLKTDSSTRLVSFSDNVEILCIPRIQESELDLCFYNSEDFAEFRHEEWEERWRTGLFGALSSCWKERERDDEEMTDSRVILPLTMATSKFSCLRIPFIMETIKAGAAAVATEIFL